MRWKGEKMTDKEFAKRLKNTVEKPDSAAKDAFIRSRRRELPFRKMSMSELIWMQAHYIRPGIWILSVLLLLSAIIWFGKSGGEAVNGLSMMMPFLAGFGLLEGMRSRFCGMADLEQSTLVSARGAILAKLAAIGIVHIGIVLILSVLIGSAGGYGFLRTGCMLIVPYLLSSVIGMRLERTPFGRSNPFLCMAGAAAVSFTIYYFGDKLDAYAGMTEVFIAATVILIFAQGYELKKIGKPEEVVWN